MDILVFISDLVRSLAWPLVVLVLVILFRKPLGNLIPYLRRLKYGKLEAEFIRDLETADNKAQSLPPLPPSAIQPDYLQSLLATLLDISKKSPTASILETWRNIEIQLSRFLDYVSPEQRKIPSWGIVDKLYKRETIDSDFKSLIDQLRIVRNEAAHPTGRLEISERQAVTYIQSSIRAIDYLRNIQL